MKVMGIDPGYDRCGYAVVESEAMGSYRLLDSGALTTLRTDSLAMRLLSIARGLDQLIALHQPQQIAVEEIYFAKNAKTAINVAHARGVILEHAALAGIELAEYAPSSIKAQLTGSGKADKKQVEFMTRRMVSLPPGSRLDDELDAIAAALCHCQRMLIPGVLR